VISVRKLCKSHGDTKILVDVSAEIAKGETIAIVGPSGGGKSTLLRCLNYMESFDGGEIQIGDVVLTPGLPVSSPLLRALRTRVGMVFQQFNLFPHLSVLENITLAPQITRGITPDAATKKAKELLERVGLAAKADVYPHQLSGGQQQRVAIARALAQEPDVMLFDEPTSALDPEMTDEVMNVVKDLARAGMTMVVVTHEMSFAEGIATRIWVIERGTIAEDGPPSEVIANPQTAVAKEYFGRRKR